MGDRREGALVRRARAAERAGDLAAAVDARQAAAEVLRRSGAGGQTLGRVLYDLAGTLLERQRPDDAIAALDEAEQAYGGQFADGVADVQARRAVAYGLAGAGASAVVDAQSAVLQRRGGKRRELARALAVNADVLAAYGDPDLAVASADLAVRLFLAGRVARGPDRVELDRALAVAVAGHTAHGRPDLARQAAAVARRVGAGRPGEVGTVLGGRGLGPVTVAGALAAARARLGREPPLVADRSVVRPAVDLELVVPLDRVGTAGADAAVRLGRTLAGLATELLPLDGPAGARLGLEAHALLAGAARLGSELLADRLPAFGPPWAAALLGCSRQAGADSRLALDLAAWGAGVAEQLLPAALVDRETRAVTTETLHHHGTLATTLRSPPR